MDPTRGNAPIVVGVDGSDHALQAVRWAAQTATARRAPLALVHAVGVPDLYAGVLPPTPKVLEALWSRGQGALEYAKKTAERSGATNAELVIRDGTPAVVLREASRKARMLVLGASGHGRFMAAVALGSTAAQVTMHAACPIVVVRGEQPAHGPGSGPVVVGIDGSPLSEAALDAAFEEASLRGVRLIAVHAWRDPYAEIASMETGAELAKQREEAEQRLLAERLAGWGEKYPDLTVERKLVRGQPRHTLLYLSGDAQLVVVGSRGRGGFTGLLLGSTSHALVHHASCSVMIVRPDETRGA